MAFYTQCVKCHFRMRKAGKCMKQCSNKACQALNEENNKFCTVCGTIMSSDVAPSSSVKQVKCVNENCDAYNDEGSKFCLKCGTPQGTPQDNQSITLKKAEQAPTPSPKEPVKETPIAPTKTCVNPSCRAENPLESNFCFKCATPFHLASAQPTPEVTRVAEPTPPPPPTPPAISKKRKKWPMIVGLVALCLIIGAIIASFMWRNETALIKKLDEAASKKDANLYFEQLTTDPYNDVSLKAYNALLKKQDIQELSEETKDMIRSLSATNVANIEDEVQLPSKAGKLIVRKYSPLGLSFLAHYNIYPVPFLAHVKTNVDDVKLVFGDQRTTLQKNDDWEEILLPGKYEYTVEYKSKFGDLKELRKVNISKQHSNMLNATFKTKEVTLTTKDLPKLTFTVNGEKMNLSNEYADGVLSIPSGAEFDLVAKFKEDGKTYKSKKLHVSEYLTDELEFPKYKQ